MPYTERADHIIKWLTLPQKERPHFLTLYFEAADDYGHTYGPNSVGVDSAIVKLDSIVGYLYSNLETIKMKDSVNVIIVADHGMTEISPDKIIDVSKILTGYKFSNQDDGPFMTITPEKGKLDEVYNILRKNENHFKVYKKSELPSYYHYSENSFILLIIFVVDFGWSLTANGKDKWLKKTKGNHGYDNNALDMQGIFIADGPAFKKDYKTGTIWNIDIYPLLCKIFKIQPHANIDGKLERIGFILK